LAKNKIGPAAIVEKCTLIVLVVLVVDRLLVHRRPEASSHEFPEVSERVFFGFGFC
jgi:hypothetical protein